MQSTALPDTPAGRRLEQWLGCLVGGELERLRDFAAAHYSAAALAERDAETRAALDVVHHRNTGGLLVARVERSSKTELVLAARAQLTGELVRLHGAVEVQPPHPIIGIELAYLSPLDHPYKSIVCESELVAELGDFVDLLAGADCFSGAVLLARGDEVLLERAHGLARREPTVPNRPQTRFNHASIQKMFTAVAIAQLAEQGLLDFADTVSKHLPDYPRAIAKNVTIDQLLTHTSGLGSPARDRYLARRTSLRAVCDHLALVAGESLLFEPGERFGYSNAGYVLLGAIVEQVSGQDYYDYVREHIYGPAGMADSDSIELDRDHPRLATGYTLRDPERDPPAVGPLRANDWALPHRGSPSGLGCSTVGDLHRFGRALLAHKLLSPKLTELVLSAKELVGEGYSYCYGFEESRFGAIRSVGHGGRYAGASADLSLYPELGYTVAVLSNYDPPAAERVGNQARRLIEASWEAWHSSQRSAGSSRPAGQSTLKRFEKRLAQINELEPALELDSDAGLRARYQRLRERAFGGTAPQDLLCESFALTREASKRALGQRHLDVQLIGGMALQDGSIAEIKAGERKTLTATLPICLNALYARNRNGSPAQGKGVHLVTVNDYLARHDALSMKPIYDLLGVTVGVLQADHRSPEQKAAAYAADVTYGTNSEFAFDYLRDNLAADICEKSQRGHGYAIVDEVDSVLIDQARTPLIISGRRQQPAADVYSKFAELARLMQPANEPYEAKPKSQVFVADFDFDERHKTVAVTARGVETAQRFLGIDDLYRAEHDQLVNHLQQALKAQSLYKRGVDYEVIDGQVKIIDEFTGRLLDGRRWSEGLHQAIEAKEGVAIQQETQTIATITCQNYFRRYDKLAGMTGTALTEASELMKVYKLAVVEIPTNRPIARRDLDDQIYRTKEGKWAAVLREITQRNERGQPVLVGTVSVKASELLSEQLKQRGLEHSVLNAKPEHAEREAEIIAAAGRPGAVTIATNIAGGIAIELGGNAEHLTDTALQSSGHEPGTPQYDNAWDETLASVEEQVERERNTAVKSGGLFVLGTARHESRRIDNRLRGVSGRQGDPGESRFYLSAKDDLVRLFARDRIQRILDNLEPVGEEHEQQPIENKALLTQFDAAQRRVEEHNSLLRRRLLDYDEVINEQRETIYAYRDKILAGEDMSQTARVQLADLVERIASDYLESDLPKNWDLQRLYTQLEQIYPIDIDPQQLDIHSIDRDGLIADLRTDITEAYGHRERELGAERMRAAERFTLLSTIDERWREHLHDIDHLREHIHLRGFAGVDPLVAYKDEAARMFTALMTHVWEDYARHVFNVDTSD